MNDHVRPCNLKPQRRDLTPVLHRPVELADNSGQKWILGRDGLSAIGVTDGVIGRPACRSLEIVGAALQADGETRSAFAASSIRRRSVSHGPFCRTRRISQGNKYLHRGRHGQDRAGSEGGKRAGSSSAGADEPRLSLQTDWIGSRAAVAGAGPRATAARRITVTVTPRFRAECVAKLRLRLSAKAWNFRPRTAHCAAVSCWVVRLGTAVRKMICKVFREDTCGAVDMIIDYTSVVRRSWCRMPINSCCIDCCWLIVNGVGF